MYMYVLQASLEELMDGSVPSSLSVYDEAALCSNAFKWVVYTDTSLSVCHAVSILLEYYVASYIHGYMKLQHIKIIMLTYSYNISIGIYVRANMV